MPVSFKDGRAAGWAEVSVVGADLPDPASLEISIAGAEAQLDPRDVARPWRSDIFWFTPTDATLTDGTLRFELEPAITWHLSPNLVIDLVLRDVTGAVRRERAAVPRHLRRPSQPPAGYVPPIRPTMPKTPVIATTPPVEIETPAVTIVDAVVVASPADRLPQSAAPARRVPWFLAIGAVLVLALIGFGFTFKDKWLDRAEPPTPTPVAAPALALNLDGARTYLQSNPSADAAAKKAAEFAAAKSLDGAFLIYRQAANQGSTAAQLALGQMYDPATYSAETSPLPAANPEQAADWYGKAAEAGSAEAQYRLGVLLMTGKVDRPNGPEVGVAWLRKSAAQGNEAAKAALAKMQ